MLHLLSCGGTDLGKQAKKDNEAALVCLYVLRKMWELGGRIGVSPSGIWRWLKPGKTMLLSSFSSYYKQVI